MRVASFCTLLRDPHATTVGRSTRHEFAKTPGGRTADKNRLTVASLTRTHARSHARSHVRTHDLATTSVPTQRPTRVRRHREETGYDLFRSALAAPRSELTIVLDRA
jgi:hypothetical protein